MKRFQQSLVFASAAHRFFAALLVLHVLAVIALVASPRLHHWIHPDDDNDDHDCAVTLFLHGGTSDAAPAAIQVFALSPESFFVLAAGAEQAWVSSIFAASSISEHAPPGVS